MTVMDTRIFGQRFVQGIPAGLVSGLAVCYALGVVVLFASGRLTLLKACLLLSGPIVLALATLRPEWMILVIAALPPSVISPIPPLQLVAVMLVTLFGFLLQGRLRLGPRTGIYPFAGIIALAITLKADIPAIATVAADAMLKHLIYYTILMLVAFHAVANRKIRIDTFVNALLLGIVGGAILQPFVGTISSFESIDYSPFRGQFAYLATMAFGVAYVRFSLGRSEGRRQTATDALLVFAFFCLTAIGFGRATWIAALWIVGLVSKWTGRKWFWAASALFLVVVLTVPVVAERITSSKATGADSQVTLTQLTTGRSVLWEDLWKRGTDALPFGQGWGYTWSLSPTDVFGFKTFVVGTNPFVYPHDDFLYLFVELGVMGFGLLLVFWLHLLRTIRSLSRSRIVWASYSVRVLVPVIIVMFVVQLFDNGFAIRFVAERFFMAAGLVFGLAYTVRLSGTSAIAGSRYASPGTSQILRGLDL
jgi:O-Antigen ligase